MNFAGILFGSASEIKAFRFPAGEPVRTGDVLDFAEFFWNGGTDFEAPLAAAAGLLEAEYNADGKMRGDIAPEGGFHHDRPDRPRPDRHAGKPGRRL